MRLNQQRDALVNGILDASIDLNYFRSAILRKMAAPYGDGSRSNMVNAETDVLPRLNAILDTLATTLEATNRASDFQTSKQPEAVRVW